MRVTWSVGILILLLVTVMAGPAEAAGPQSAKYRANVVNPMDGCSVSLGRPVPTCLPRDPYDPASQFFFSDDLTSGATVSLVDQLGVPVLFKVGYGEVTKVCVNSCSAPAGAVRVMIDPIFFSPVELAQNAGVALPTVGVINVAFA